MQPTSKANERRAKYRFDLQRELRYKVTSTGTPPIAGVGQTINMCSGGIAFTGEHTIEPGAFVELSVSWPALLDDSCPMRLIVFGRVLRTSGLVAVCSIEKYEFRTAARTFQPRDSVRSDSMLQRWAEGMRKGVYKESLARV
jgi:hypothetical protein